MPGAITSIPDLIKRLKEARKLIGGRWDGQKLDDVKGKVKIDASQNLVIPATFKHEGVAHEVDAKRKAIGEKATIKIDGETKENPDIDIKIKWGSRLRCFTYCSTTRAARTTNWYCARS